MPKYLNVNLAIICTFVVINVQLQHQLCDGTWITDIGWKSSDVVTSLANTLKERARDSEGAVNDLDKSNKIFRRLSKLGAAAGSIFALAGAVFSSFDQADARRHKELLREFSAVKNGLDNINSKMDKIIKVIKHEHSKTKGFQSFVKIEGAALVLDNYNKNYREQSIKEHYKARLMRYLDNNDMYNALISIYKLVNDGDSIVKTLYQQTHGDLGAINKLRAYIEGLIYTGSVVQATICTLDQMDKNGKSAKQAKKICYDVVGDDFEHLEKNLNRMFNTVANNAKQKYKENIQNTIDEEYDSNDFKQNNEDISTSIRNKLKSNYGWVDVMVGVYNPIEEGDKHAMYTQAHGFQDKNGQKNWFVMADDKENTQSKTITRSKLKTIVENARCFTSSKRNCYDSGLLGTRCSPAGGCYSDANSYLEAIKSSLAHSGVSCFGLAVIKRYNGLYGAWTSSNKFFFFNFDKFTVIGGIKGTILETDTADWNVVTTGNECWVRTWTYQYFSDTQQCVNYIRTHRGDCNQRYTIHAVRGDGNCGCVNVGVDCKNQANWHAASVVDIIEMMDKSDSGYTWIDNTLCSGSTIDVYTNLRDAQNACSLDNNCQCVDDFECDGNLFYTRKGSQTTSSSKDCAWIDSTGINPKISANEYIGDWIQAPSSSLGKLDASCVEISDTEIKCTFRKSNGKYFSNNFTVRGSSIRNSGESKVTGNYNNNNGTITWHIGSSYYTKWYRPNGMA